VMRHSTQICAMFSIRSSRHGQRGASRVGFELMLTAMDGSALCDLRPANSASSRDSEF
jgi:hypothetical protein